MRVLWKKGRCTVRQVHEALREEQDQDTVYTTVLKLLRNMTEKGLVRRDERERTHVYEAAGDCLTHVGRGVWPRIVEAVSAHAGLAAAGSAP